MFNPKAFLLFLTVLALLGLAVDARQGSVNVWLAIAGATAAIAIELVMTFGPALRGAFRNERRS